MKSMSINRALPVILFALVLGVGVVAAPAIGPAWDEPDNIHSGGVYWKFFQQGLKPQALTNPESKQASLFGERVFTQKHELSRYPPFANLVGTGVVVGTEKILDRDLSGREIITIFHLLATAFFAVLVAFVYKWGRLLGMTRAVSGVTAILAFLYPTLFGYGFSNTKDIAQTSLFTVSLYYMVFGLKGPTTKKGWSLMIGSVVWGLALATKINAIYVPVIWGGYFFLRNWRDWSNFRKLAKFLFIGLTTAFLLWPYLWFEPRTRVWEVVSYFSGVGQGYKLIWNGQLFSAGSSGLWWYPLLTFVYQTPPPVLIIGLIGLISLAAATKGGRWVGLFANPRSILLIWIAVPLMRIFFPAAVFYDGNRHFLEVIPAVMLVVGVGLETIAESLRSLKRFRLQNAVKLSSIVGLMGYLVFLNFQFFPYSTGYYNFLAQNPNSNFDRDIAGLSVKEGVDWLHANRGKFRLYMPIARHLGWYYFQPDDIDTYELNAADAVIVVNKVSHTRVSPEVDLVRKSDKFVLAKEIKRGPAVFGWVYVKAKSGL